MKNGIIQALRLKKKRVALLFQITAFFLPANSFGQAVAYEATSFPELEGWERRLADTPGADRSLSEGWFFQAADLPQGWPGPDGDADFYRRPLGDFVGPERFFVEWHVVTDVPGDLLDLNATPVSLAAGGRGQGFYHCTITNSRVQLFRDTMLPLVFVDIEPDVPHLYRLELDGNKSYSWIIDGMLVDTGSPQGPYPDPTAFLIWGVRREYVDSLTAWDYVRYGVIPADGSGDFDSDAAITASDFYFVQECLTNERPGINGGPAEDAGPGCRFADFDSDSDVDLLDLAEFQNLFSAP